MKSMNWISGTGRSPYRAIPIAVPMIPASASGVSNTRSGNSSIRPSVHRKTPPLRPTSSPRITTRSSRRISSRSALFTACTMFICGIGSAPRTWRRGKALRGSSATPEPPGVLELLPEVRRHLRIHVREHGLDRRRGRALDRVHRLRDRVVELLAEPRVRLRVPDPPRDEVAAHQVDRVPTPPGLDLLLVPV